MKSESNLNETEARNEMREMTFKERIFPIDFFLFIFLIDSSFSIFMNAMLSFEMLE